MKKALITGISGQDGSYLAEFLLISGYEVHGVVRRTSTESLSRIVQVLKDPLLKVHQADLTDFTSISRVVKEVMPDEIYNLAAQSFVKESFNTPTYTGNVTGLGVTRLLEAVRECKPDARVYQASSSEMFGKVQRMPQDESTPFYPRSPYGVAKLYGHWMTINYRESFDMFCVSGILYNHESPRRGSEFVTRKITKAVAEIAAGRQKKLYLGNLEAKRDWSYAKDMVRAMWLMLQNDKPVDYVVGSGTCHSVKEFVEAAFSCVSLDWREYVEVDPKFFRPAEVDVLLSNPSKIKSDLGWEAETSFKDLVKLMVVNDMKEAGLL